MGASRSLPRQPHLAQLHAVGFHLEDFLLQGSHLPLHRCQLLSRCRRLALGSLFVDHQLRRLRLRLLQLLPHARRRRLGCSLGSGQLRRRGLLLRRLRLRLGQLLCCCLSGGQLVPDLCRRCLGGLFGHLQLLGSRLLLHQLLPHVLRHLRSDEGESSVAWWVGRYSREGACCLLELECVSWNWRVRAAIDASTSAPFKWQMQADGSRYAPPWQPFSRRHSIQTRPD